MESKMELKLGPREKLSNGKTTHQIKGPFTVWKRGKPMNSEVKTLILNVFTKLQIENPTMKIDDLVSACSDLTGVSEHAVTRLRTEFHKNGKFTTPGKKRPRKTSSVTRFGFKHTGASLCAVRRVVYDFFRRREMPTLNKILAVIEGDPTVNLPIMARSTLDRLLKDLGFIYLKPRKHNSILVEKDDIVVWRRKYLRDIKQFRLDNRKIYFLDETFIDVEPKKVRIKEEGESPSPDDSCSPELPEDATGKGSRLVIMHAGGAGGLVTGAATVFHAEKGGELMDGPFFETWFEDKLIPNLQPNSVIVMDNAWYHSLKVEPLPTVIWRKNEIQKWLTGKNVKWTRDQLKPELFQLVEVASKQCNIYRVDQIAEKHGHRILCLPPFHSDLNPIEEVWLRVKQSVPASKVTDADSIKRIVEDTLAKVISEEWIKFESNAMKKESEMWEVDEMVEDLIDKALATNGADSSSESDDEGPYFEEELMINVDENPSRMGMLSNEWELVTRMPESICSCILDENQ